MSMKLMDKIELVRDATAATPSSLVSSIQVPAVNKSQVLLPETVSPSTLATIDTSQTLTNKTYNVGTANKALVTDSSGNIAASATTSTEVGYLAGVTSSIQTQINILAAKVALEIQNTSSLTVETLGPISSTDSVIIGSDLVIDPSGNLHTVYGHGATSNSNDNVVIGASSTAYGSSTVIGTAAAAGSGSGLEVANVAIGASTKTYKQFVLDPDVNDSIAIGTGAWSKAPNSISIGSGAIAVTQGDIVIGVGAQVTGASSLTNQTTIAIGRQAQASQGTIALGSATHPLTYTPGVITSLADGYLLVNINGSTKKLYFYP